MIPGMRNELKFAWTIRIESQSEDGRDVQADHIVAETLEVARRIVEYVASTPGVIGTRIAPVRFIRQ